MPATATVLTDRATINRANSQYSTGPRTEAGKQRSSQNALRHGLTARTAVLASEDPATYEQHCRQFQNEYQPATQTETQLVQELADTSWRLKRIPILEAALLDRALRCSPAREQGDSPESPVPSPQSLVPQLAALGLHGSRLSRQFQKTLDQLRDIQFERRQHQRRELRDAAAILELHKHKGIPWQPSDHGFVFSKEQVERCSERMMRQNEARYIAAERFNSPPLAPAWEFRIA
jgi:hypothetical protein